MTGKSLYRPECHFLRCFVKLVVLLFMCLAASEEMGCRKLWVNYIRWRRHCCHQYCCKWVSNLIMIFNTNHYPSTFFYTVHMLPIIAIVFLCDIPGNYSPLALLRLWNLAAHVASFLLTNNGLLKFPEFHWYCLKIILKNFQPIKAHHILLFYIFVILNCQVSLFTYSSKCYIRVICPLQWFWLFVWALDFSKLPLCPPMREKCQSKWEPYCCPTLK